jgi:hypothetical protein
VYEPSTAAYRSRWFCIVKKDGKSLRLVHNLQPLNVVTICDTSLPLFVEHLAESFAGYVVYGMMDLYSGYDQRVLHKNSRDLTTFGMPLGPHRLTTLPQGHANAVQVYQGDTAEGTKSDCGACNQSLDVRSTTLLVRQYVGSRCA